MLIKDELILAAKSKDNKRFYQLVETCRASKIKYNTIYRWVMSILSMAQFEDNIRKGDPKG